MKAMPFDGNVILAEVGRACLCHGLEDVEEMVPLLVEVVHGVGIVPEDAEVGCRRMEVREGTDNLVRVRDASRVLVLRHAPDALDRRVALDEAAHHVHVGAVFLQGNRHVLDSVVGRDLEVAVIPRRRAEELDLALLAPWLVPCDAVRIGVADDVVHEVQARRADNDDIGRIDTKIVSRKAACRRQAIRTSVVVHLERAIHQIGMGIHEVEHRTGEVSLLGRRLATRHIERKPLRLEIFNLLLELRDGAVELFGLHAFIYVAHVASLIVAAQGVLHLPARDACFSSIGAFWMTDASSLLSCHI